MCIFEGGVYYGQVSRSKQLAKTACSAAVVDKLLREGKLDVHRLITSIGRKRIAARAEAAMQINQAPSTSVSCPITCVEGQVNSELD